jgi:hypothetical protein
LMVMFVPAAWRWGLKQLMVGAARVTSASTFRHRPMPWASPRSAVVLHLSRRSRAPSLGSADYM